MADNQFEFNGEEIKVVNERGVATGLPRVVSAPMPGGIGGGERETGFSENSASPDDLFAALYNKNSANQKVESVQLGKLNFNPRYGNTFVGAENEEMFGQQQSALDKWANASAKFLGVASTTFISGTAGLFVGAGMAISENKLSKLINNPVTQAMDESMKKLEDYAPNYYTKKETEADWYSTDNILTANFFSDKVFKNLGFSLGAIGGGVAWGSLFKTIGLTNKLVQAGYGLEAATVAEQAALAAPNLSKLNAVSEAIGSLSQKYIKSPLGSALKQSDRILTSTMGTFGEAAMEGLQGMNEFRQSAIDKYREEYGVAPTGAELDRINGLAEQVGNNIWGANTLLLTATNYIQLPKILGSSKKLDKALINNVVLDETTDSFIKAGYRSKLGKIYSRAKNIGGLAFSGSEAFEEGAQAAISTGVNNYFNRAYNNKKDTTDFIDTSLGVMSNVFGEGVRETLTTKEGLESILIGGLSGGLQQSGIVGTYTKPDGSTGFGLGKSGKIGERGFAGEGGERAANTEKALTELNLMKGSRAIKDAVKFMSIGIGSQKLRQQAIQEDDTLSEKDYEKDYSLSYLMPRIKYGKLESVLGELDSYIQQASTPEGFFELHTSKFIDGKETSQSFITKIQALKESAIATEKIYDTVNEKYENLLNEQGTQKYTSDAIDSLVYSASKIKDYDARIPSVNNDLVLAGVPTIDFVTEILKNDDKSKEKIEEPYAYIESLDILDDAKQDLRDKVTDLAELALRRKQFVKEYNDILKEPGKYKTKTFTDTDEPELPEDPGNIVPKETIKLKTKQGEKDIEIGSEYFLGNVMAQSKTGQAVYTRPLITVVGKNEDGTIKIITGEGETIDVNESIFLKYSLQAIDAEVSDPKVKFILSNWNVVYEHAGIKVNGKRARGRIEYSNRANYLTFSYLDEKGNIKRVPVKHSSFNPAGNYKKAMVYPMEKLNAIQFQSLEDIFSLSETPSSIAKSALDLRNSFITEFYEASLEKSKQISKTLIDNKFKLESLIEQINKETSFTKDGKPRKRLMGQARKLVNVLAKQAEELVQANVALESEKTEIEENLPFFKNYVEDLKNTDEDVDSLVDNLKTDIERLEKVIDFNTKEITRNKSLLESLNELLTAAFDYVNQFIRRLKEENPNIPLTLDEYQTNLEKVMDTDAANLLIEDKLGFTSQTMELESQLDEVLESYDIPSMEKQSDKLVVIIDKLTKELDSAIAEQISKRNLLEKFESFVMAQKSAKDLQEKLGKNSQLKKELMNTRTKTTQTSITDTSYEQESKKDKTLIPISTITMGKVDHAVRANAFGTRLDSLPNRKYIKGVIVTSKTDKEGSIIPGLINHLVNTEGQIESDNVNSEEVIALVMVEVDPKTGVQTLINEFGKPITGDDLLNNAIYQVYPTADLAWSNRYGSGKNATMFRKEVSSEEQDAIREKYDKWRKSILALEDPSMPQSIEASFGILQKETFLSEEGEEITDYEARNTVQSAGLLDNDKLTGGSSVISIPKTNNTIIQGTTTFVSPLGVPFLSTPTGNVKLNNRKLSNTEAEIIFESILEYSKNVFNPDKGTKHSDSKRLIVFLQSIVYWGIPTTQDGTKKDTIGFNSVFFDNEDSTGRLILRVGTDNIFDFTPYLLEENKEAITFALTGLYNNVNSALVNKTDEKYEQITGFSKTGEVESILWPNYQSYLLSDTLPSDNDLTGKKRDINEIPLVTNARKLNDADDINRDGIYFYTPERTGEFTVKLAPKVAEKTPTLSPTFKPSASAKADQVITDISQKEFLLNDIEARKKLATTPEEIAALDKQLKAINTFPIAPKGKVITDGQTISTFTSRLGNKLLFVVKEGVNASNFLEKVSVLGALDLQLFLDTIQEQMGLTKDETVIKIKEAIYDSFAPQLEENDGFTGSFSEEDYDYSYQYPGPAEDNNEPESVKDNPLEGKDVNSANPIIEDALEKAKEQNPEVSKSIEQIIKDEIDSFDDEDFDELTRLVDRQVESIVTEDWAQVEKFLKSKFPNVTVYRVKNILTTSNGRQAWGMFKNGAIYVYENAEVGTTYHEVFHSVWRMFTDKKEQDAVLNEFFNRKGTFFDRKSGKTVNYSEATELQAEEILAEEFRDFIQDKKIPNKPQNSRPFILKMFIDLWNFIKNFFLGKTGLTNTENLFNNINNGKYNNDQYLNTNYSFTNQEIINIDSINSDDTSAFSLGPIINDGHKSEIMQAMTYHTISQLIQSDESLFRVANLNKNDLYNNLFNTIMSLLAKKSTKALQKSKLPENQNPEKQAAYTTIISDNILFMEGVREEWLNIAARHQEFLKSYQIEFDENDIIQLADEDSVKESDRFDATKIDSFKKASPAIKLLLSVLPEINTNGNPVANSTVGYKLMPASKVFITLMNRLHDSRTIDEMLRRLKELAIEDNSYALLYKRITGSSITSPGEMNYFTIKTTHGSKVLDSFWKTFKKINPKVLNIYIFENGETVVGNANLASAADQLKVEYLRNINQNIKSKNSLFKFNERTGLYVVDPNKIGSINVSNPFFATKFLTSLGIIFTIQDYNRLDNLKKANFMEFAGAIRNSIATLNGVKYVSGKVLNIDNRLYQISLLKAGLDNPEFDSTYFNMSNEKTQSYIGTNATSDTSEFINSLENFSETSTAGTQYAYLSTDVFTDGSNILERKFDSKGNPKESGKDLLQVGYVGGIIDQKRGKTKASSKLSFKERILQELVLNKEGWYLNLIPGDSSLEWVVKMGNPISEVSFSRGFGDTYEIFKKYFISEVNLSRDGRTIASVKARDTKDMRFFKDILSEELLNEIKNSNSTPEEIYEANKSKIESSLKNYIENNTAQYREMLLKYGIIEYTAEGVVLQNVNSTATTENELTQALTASTINFMITNIEMHKIFYSDPYQYKDELKRIKSFNSPRQYLMAGSKNMNSVYDRVWNAGYSAKDIGYTHFSKDMLRTVSYDDIEGVIDLPGYGNYTETDGAGIVGFKAYREIRIRASDWNDANESQFRYDIAWEKNEKGLKVSDLEKSILENGNPAVKSTYTPLKPIVSGNKANGNNFNDIVLDKFALYPLSYRVMSELNKNSNALKLYNKMQKENIDYMVFDSGRKVNNFETIPLYDKKGGFNSVKYKPSQIVNVPFAILGIQTEVPSKDNATVGRGSQITKLVTMDFLEAGIPIDYRLEETNFTTRFASWNKLTREEKLKASDIYKEVQNNQDLLEAMTNLGLENLMSTLGIELQEGKYVINDFSKAGATLRNEILKREVNDNISASLTSFLEKGIALETTPAYQQIRNILYSIADREVTSPKITGGMKVQITSTLLESVRAKEITINGNKGFTSEALNFYVDEDGKRVCEIMVGRWFKSDKTDAELIEYLNKTKEGQQILSGIGFRIPTQKQNSIDAFVIKQFLPKEFGDSVVVPAALVAKVGSDFDIDKLSIYFKNVIVGKDGFPKLIPYFGIGEQAIKEINRYLLLDFFTEKKKVLSKLIGNSNLLDTLNSIADNTAPEKVQRKWIPILAEFFPEFIDENNNLDVDSVREVLAERIRKLTTQKEKLTNEQEIEILTQFNVMSIYKKSLQNAYIQSTENLVSHPANFNRLIQPNSAEQLKGISAIVAKATIGKSFDYTNVGNMLSRVFMPSLRHAFVSGKQAIGIAAVAQTFHSLKQRQPIFLDANKISQMSEEESYWLGNGKITFAKYNEININNKMVPTLSMIKNREGQDISDINGQFIDGYVDISKGAWIMELGATPNVASTWLFLVSLGVPIKEIAFFINQPLIRNYLRQIENNGYSYLFINTYLEEITDSLLEKASVSRDNFEERKQSYKIPVEASLQSSMGKTIQEMSKQESLGQLHMLWEFVKYAKLSEQVFQMTQGTNFDTANFNDPTLLFKKHKQLEKARTTVFSSLDENNQTVPAVDMLLKNSFIGNLSDNMTKMRDGLSNILFSDQPKVREIVQKTLEPYIDLSNRSFVKLAQKIVADLFDFTVQTSSKDQLGAFVKNIMTEGGVAQTVNSFVSNIKRNPSHPLHNNLIVNLIEFLPPNQLTGVKPFNIKIKNKDNTAFEQNKVIYAFRELKGYLASGQDPAYNGSLYTNLIALSVVQSGLSNSPISFTSLIPYEDIKDIYNDVVSNIDNLDSLDAFYDLGVFQRNNSSDNEFVPNVRAALISTYNGMKYNPSMEFLPKHVKEAVDQSIIPSVLSQSTLSNAGKSKYITYSWEKQIELLTEKEIIAARKSPGGTIRAISEKKKYMRKQGDYSFILKGLYEKVTDSFNEPFLTGDNKKTYFIYKAINAWGDSYRSNEFYVTDRPSVFDNGFIKVQAASNQTVIDVFRNKNSKNQSVALTGAIRSNLANTSFNQAKENTVSLPGSNFAKVRADIIESFKTNAIARIVLSNNFNVKTIEEINNLPEEKLAEILKEICDVPF